MSKYTPRHDITTIIVINRAIKKYISPWMYYLINIMCKDWCEKGYEIHDEFFKVFPMFKKLVKN